MQLNDCAIETRVQVYAKDFGSRLTMVFGPDTDTITVNALVIAKRSTGDVYVAFATNLIGQTQSSHLVSMKWWRAGYTHGLWVNGKCECLPEEVPTLRQIECPKEGPCRQCKRTNDFGAKTCWLCAVSDPTNLNKVGP